MLAIPQLHKATDTIAHVIELSFLEKSCAIVIESTCVTVLGSQDDT